MLPTVPPPMLPHLLASGAESAVGTRAEEIVLRLLIQFVAVLVTTRVVVAVARRLGQTDVAGEILAGLLLGPSLLGALAPGAMKELFHSSTSPIFVGLAQVGLILLMFQIGQEFELRPVVASAQRHRILVVSLAGIVVPFALGYFTAPWFHSHLADPRPSLLGFRLFFAVAMSITAIPILGRIFMELGLSHTPLSAITIGAAAIDDVIGWLLLGVISLIVTDHFSATWILWRLGGLLVYLAVMLLVVRPLCLRFIGKHLQRHERLRPSAIAWILVLLFASATVTSTLGVFAIIGGFVMGVALHEDRRFVHEWKARMSPLVGTFFLPLFFTFTGLRTDIGSLSSGAEWVECGLVLAVAFVGKFGGVYAAARALGAGHRSAATLGTAMNTRALMELVALNIGHELGVLPRSMFTKLVIMAIVSTFIATPLIQWLMREQRVVVERGAARLRLRTALPVSEEGEVGVEQAREAVWPLLSRSVPESERLAPVGSLLRALLESVPHCQSAAPATPPMLEVLVEGSHVTFAVTFEYDAGSGTVAVLERHLVQSRAAADPKSAVFGAEGSRSSGEGAPEHLARLLAVVRRTRGRIALSTSGDLLTLTAELDLAPAASLVLAAA